MYTNVCAHTHTKLLPYKRIIYGITLKSKFFLVYLKSCSNYTFFKENIYFLMLVCVTSAESNFQ